MGRVWTSDLHWGHANIIRFTDRPFLTGGDPDLHRMHVAICRALNDAAGPDDDLWLLGDIAMGNVDSTLRIRDRLRAGRVFLVPGNHDKCHPMHKKAEAWRTRYEDAGFIVTDPVVDVTLSDGTSVQVSHFPFMVEPKRMDRPDRFAAWRPVDDGRWLLHGHTHGAWRQRGQQIDVGIDAWGGSPVPEETLLEHVRLVTDLGALPWAP